MNLRYPNITGSTLQEQLVQIRGYLYQLVEQLNMETDSNVQTGAGAAGKKIATDSTTGNGAAPGQSPKSTFNQIKSLIIKSAEIVDAYYMEINRRLEGVYLAESEFGTYRQETAQDIRATAEKVDQAFTNIQSITGQLEKLIKVNANIRTGLLYSVGEDGDPLAPELPVGTPVYGVEVGQTIVVDGEEVFDEFARFTAYGMMFYDENGNVSAYITDRKLRIPHAVIEQSLTRGGFVETISSDGSCVERWVGV